MSIQLVRGTAEKKKNPSFVICRGRTGFCKEEQQGDHGAYQADIAREDELAGLVPQPFCGRCTQIGIVVGRIFFFFFFWRAIL